jgi:hypothetical protein
MGYGSSSPMPGARHGAFGVANKEVSSMLGGLGVNAGSERAGFNLINEIFPPSMFSYG